MPTQNPNSGYHPCPCRDCFETAIGCGPGGETDPALCHDCDEANCDSTGESECQVVPLEDLCSCQSGSTGHDDPDCDGLNGRSGKTSGDREDFHSDG